MAPVVDVHTHIYPPAYVSLLRSRKDVPYMRTFPDNPSAGERLVILPSEDAATSTARGRPIGPEYYEEEEKIKFMDKHHIDISVISLANPWLDWCDKGEAAEAARMINDDVEAVCARHAGRLYAFGTLPLSAGAEAVVEEIKRLQALKYSRGVIIGTSGLGAGLDDPAMNPIWNALQETKQLVFLHPHYGLPASVYGDRANDYGHVLPLALGFPLETTIAITRAILSGVFDHYPNLEILLAHSGGTLPFLAGRIESCIAHDGHLKHAGKTEGRRSIWEILKSNIYLDAVVYAEPGLKAAIEASGMDRCMFGTDHPFFPPLEDEGDEWVSVKTNAEAVGKAFGTDEAAREAVMGGNAVRVLRLG
ncbi:hypothetical protein AUEXF2481DRAFT_45034 [Aureobasidium subglaciale EXF-2481]|uniref:Amidohydrolase-related domain-containing protein n=1 Tax=Aureobasidium subglaciale (strain EXF-2481) TaxID=1043005 RepID=A0A074Y3G2_AURSE|nr:uncharacterized protein AUEXF2481DRAFT_45034 [Aureobasidium subglaciale EXF-2481]KEQ90479.1 hypothetical protein AUEXF2481DRAFT_45034 [Aureobasidium subglaciale EXF-2481]